MRALHLNENAMIVQLVLSWKAMYTLPLKFPAIPDNSSNISMIYYFTISGITESKF
jgi:hypothetical protein